MKAIAFHSEVNTFYTKNDCILYVKMKSLSNYFHSNVTALLFRVTTFYTKVTTLKKELTIHARIDYISDKDHFKEEVTIHARIDYISYKSYCSLRIMKAHPT